MTNDFEKTGNDIINAGKLIVIAMFMIFLVYKVAEIIIGQLPATVATVVIGLTSVYMYTTNTKVRKSVNDWLNQSSEE
ncbi:hypothetical protein CUN85_06455 [Methanolobus halotolerans]|uniref:Uncharacterized protein n=2 Tax=Methanolobus halotolerans TaxID=2052935 RepID=A0A4E0Q641_9EURY|nr:hypothetical protein CUN85_06455 [Methanolobus halotolerans]